MRANAAHRRPAVQSAQCTERCAATETCSEQEVRRRTRARARPPVRLCVPCDRASPGACPHPLCVYVLHGCGALRPGCRFGPDARRRRHVRGRHAPGASTPAPGGGGARGQSARAAAHAWVREVSTSAAGSVAHIVSMALVILVSCVRTYCSASPKSFFLHHQSLCVVAAHIGSETEAILGSS